MASTPAAPKGGRPPGRRSWLEELALKQQASRRARIEQTIGKLKRFKRIALQCEKTAGNFAALIASACGLILVKSIHMAWWQTSAFAAELFQAT